MSKGIKGSRGSSDSSGSREQGSQVDQGSQVGKAIRNRTLKVVGGTVAEGTLQ